MAGLRFRRELASRRCTRGAAASSLPGVMGPSTAASKAVSTMRCIRHNEGRHSASVSASGERVQEFLGHVVGQHCQQQMRQQPTSRRRRGAGRQFIDLPQRLQALDGQFDLPSQTIHREDVCGGIMLIQRGRQDDEFRRRQAAWIEPGLLA